MDLSKKQPRRSRWHIAPRWVEVTVVCAVSLGTAFAGGRVTEATRSSDRPEPAVTVTVSATSTVTAPPPSPAPGDDSDSANGSPSEGPGLTDSASASAQPSQVFLADLDRVDDRGYVDTSPVIMLGVNHPKSVRLGCDTSSGDHMTYNVSGYKRLEAKVGIPADTDNAIGSVGSVKVFNAAGLQIGKAVTVRSSAVALLSVDITGQDQIKIGCTLVKSGDPEYKSAVSGLGDAFLSS